MAKAKRRRQEHKIIRGLKQAVEHATAEPMVFEHAPVEQTDYERISARMMAAVAELNQALQEAQECAEMRVFIKVRPRDEDHAMQLHPQIYRLTHSTMAFTVTSVPPPEPKMQWREVKDPAFTDAAGVGLSALQRQRKGR